MQICRMRGPERCARDQVVMFDCKDQDFPTVLAAIGSNNERWGINKVTLELRRPAADA